MDLVTLEDQVNDGLCPCAQLGGLGCAGSCGRRCGCRGSSGSGGGRDDSARNVNVINIGNTGLTPADLRTLTQSQAQRQSAQIAGAGNPIVVNVPRQAAPVVNVAPPAINLPRQAAPIVNVAPPVINLPRQAAPVVNVAPMGFERRAPEVDRAAPPRARMVPEVERVQAAPHHGSGRPWGADPITAPAPPVPRQVRPGYWDPRDPLPCGRLCGPVYRGYQP